MSVAHEPIPRAAGDQVVRLHGVPWLGYEALLGWRGESSVPRITYLDGELELMSPGRPHETDKTKMARLLEAWSEECGIELDGYGSWTLKNKRRRGGAEPDECYAVNRVIVDDADRPDIAIEVVYSSGGINKLDVYRRLQVREVWLWDGGELSFWALRETAGYERIDRSGFLATLDPALLVACMQIEGQSAAVRELRRRLRG